MFKSCCVYLDKYQQNCCVRKEIERELNTSKLELKDKNAVKQKKPITESNKKMQSSEGDSKLFMSSITVDDPAKKIKQITSM